MSTLKQIRVLLDEAVNDSDLANMLETEGWDVALIKEARAIATESLNLVDKALDNHWLGLANGSM